MEVIDDTANPSADLLPVVPLNQSISLPVRRDTTFDRRIRGVA